MEDKTINWLKNKPDECWIGPSEIPSCLLATRNTAQMNPLSCYPVSWTVPLCTSSHWQKSGIELDESSVWECIAVLACGYVCGWARYTPGLHHWRAKHSKEFALKILLSSSAQRSICSWTGILNLNDLAPGNTSSGIPVVELNQQLQRGSDDQNQLLKSNSILPFHKPSCNFQAGTCVCSALSKCI